MHRTPTHHTTSISAAILAIGLALLLCAGCQSIASMPTSATPGTRTASRAAATPPPQTPPAQPATSYAYGWGDLPTPTTKPGGGSTTGGPVALASGRALPLSEIAAAPDAFARDRAAILSLAGDYKVGFHFLETVGYATDYTPKQPYHSWATEHVRVIEDTVQFISLQHTLVMFMRNDDGSISGPIIQKHWRQDWNYEPAELHVFRGNETWVRRRFSTKESSGAWSQSVWQVDDSPRYAALGRWSHDGNRTIWTGETSWRPLPRREHTVRKDYGVMEGSHRIVLTPTGWLHEQLNWKRAAGESSSGSAAPASYVGEEWGLDRYERITAPSLGAADEYWKKTGAYWAAVRRAWADTFAQRDRVTLRHEVGGRKLFEEHFSNARMLEQGTPFDAAAAERHARETIGTFIAP